MSDRVPSPASLAAAAAAIGGLLILAVPGYALGIVALVMVAAAAGAALHALSAHVPAAGWVSPFKWLSPFAEPARPERRPHGADEIASIRARLGGRRQRIGPGPPLPPDALRLLKPIVAAALDVDADDPQQVVAARGRVSALTGAVLASEPLVGPYWFRTRRPNQWEVADAVHRILDELEALTLASSAPEGPTSPHHQPRVP